MGVSSTSCRRSCKPLPTLLQCARRRSGSDDRRAPVPIRPRSPPRPLTRYRLRDPDPVRVHTTRWCDHSASEMSRAPPAWLCRCAGIRRPRRRRASGAACGATLRPLSPGHRCRAAPSRTASPTMSRIGSWKTRWPSRRVGEGNAAARLGVHGIGAGRQRGPKSERRGVKGGMTSSIT